MFAIERHKFILKLLKEKGQVTTQELCEKLNISSATARNDLNKLNKDGLLKKTHGGATELVSLNSAVSIPPPLSFPNTFSFKTRVGKNPLEKHAISEHALQYIKNNQCILLDASSTTLALARKLTCFDKLIVVTNGIHTTLELKEISNITVILVGGIATKNSSSLEGTLGAYLLNHINADFAFISANGFTLTEGLTDFNIYEVALKKEMIHHSKKVIALLDSSKFENVSTASFCAASQIDLILTDENIDPELLKHYRANGVNIEVCPYVK